MHSLPPVRLGRSGVGIALFVSGALLSALVFVSPAQAARGRPYVNAAKTTIVADNGRLIRGAIISTETGSYPSVSQLEGIKAVGLNAVHCYAERRDYSAAGARVAAVDMAVQRTRDAGLYLIITIGGGGFDETYNKAFWNFYAPRYKDETHVFYEIQNEPAANNPPYGGDAALMRMELDCYGIIREKAPDTPVLIMSYSSFENGAGALQDIAALGAAIDWSKTALAFHGYGEGGPAAIRAALETVLAAGYPCFQTEFYRWPWGLGDFALAAGPSLYQDVDETGDLERLGVSWLSFLTLGRVADPARFKNPLANGGVAWAPDFGSWPGPARSANTTDGEPRILLRTNTSGLRIQAEDFDIGGEGVAYHDVTTTNSGGAYRTTEGVDVQTTTDTGGGHNVGWISSGEWLEYTTIIREAGLYTLNLRVASPGAGNGVRVKLAGVDISGAWAFAGTGGNQAWATISKTVNLRPGQQLLRVEPLSSGFNLNWIEIVPVSTGVVANGSYPMLARSTGKAVGVVGASTSNGAKLEQRGYTAASNQRWTFTHRGANQYTITSVQTGKGIDEAAGNSLGGDTLGMWGVSGGGSPGQRWIPTATDSGHHKLINARTGLAMEIMDASTADAARIQVGEYASGTYQQWALTLPVVTLGASDADLGGIEGNGGEIVVSRGVPQAFPLTVNLTKTGGAVAGTDYAALPATVVVPANASGVTIAVATIPGRFPSQPKTLTVAVGAAATSYSVGTPASASFTIRPRDSFAQWVADNFPALDQANPEVSGPLATPFGDDVPNLLRAALDIGPASAAAFLPTASVEGGHLVLRYRQLSGGQGAPGIDYNAGGLLYVVDACADIAGGAWQNGSAVVEPIGAPQVIDADTQLAVVRLKIPLSEQPRAFLRLRVVRTIP